jgi:hypothetical protein
MLSIIIIIGGVEYTLWFSLRNAFLHNIRQAAEAIGLMKLQTFTTNKELVGRSTFNVID